MCMKHMPMTDRPGRAGQMKRVFTPSSKSLGLALTLCVTALSVYARPTRRSRRRSRAVKGTLIILGGGSERGAGIRERFINRAGGPGAKFVIVPTANGNRTADGAVKTYNSDEVLAIWKTRGLKHVFMLHTARPEDGGHGGFCEAVARRKRRLV